MQAARPIDSNITFLAVESGSTLHTSAGTDAAELKQAVKDWTIITNVETRLFLDISFHVVWCDPFQEIDVFVGVKLGHLKICRRFRAL